MNFSCYQLFLIVFIYSIILIESKEWHMKPVRTIQARAQADKPQWNEKLKRFESKYGDDKYRGAMDTVNTASVEGALMYVQNEVINTTECVRKNEVNYIVFYDILFAQTNATLAEYQEDTTAAMEYGTYVSMDGGICSKIDDKDNPECYKYNGYNDVQNIGPAIGGAIRENDVRGPYPDTYWFSYPNSCIKDIWKEKTEECRKEYPGGLCKLGEKPDGIQCTYSYEILGYLNILDINGIHQMNHSKTNKSYTSYEEFCNDKDGKYKGIEFSSKIKQDGSIELVSSIPFWEDPTNSTRNIMRSKHMIQLYQEEAKKKGNNMKPLPSIDSLRQKNPECYENAIRCDESQYGCRRDLYAQICVECKSNEENCKKKDSNEKFPELIKATPKPPTTEPPTTQSPTSGKSNNNKDKDKEEGKKEKDDGNAASFTSFSMFTTLFVVINMLFSK